MGNLQNRPIYKQNLHISPQITKIQHRAPQFIEIHHKSSTNEFTSILMKLKCKNRHVTTPTSLCRIVAAIGSSRVWVQEVLGEVVSHPATMMWA
jgi:hypothetical protein